MVYWGLVRATYGDRSTEFIREAVKRKAKVSERERLYIEALEKLQLTDPLRDRGPDADYRERQREYAEVLETISIKYPDDVEARALLAYANMGRSRYGTEMIIREVLKRNPDHPGAHHYRIHNWNYHEPEQALESCRRYGEIASGIGHALHMPGHVYATVGMWHEAAISMDSATRVEKRYMKDRLTFPFNNWNYGHNRHYLSYIQEQLGMAEAAIFGARQLIDAPLDPDHNSNAPYSSHSQGIASMLRALIKFERWNDLLKSSTIPWRDIYMDKVNKAYAETRAHLGLGDLQKAEKSLHAHADLKKDLEKNKSMERIYSIQATDLKARIALARGETLIGLGLLAEAAEQQYQLQKEDNDPPRYPEVLYVSLGRAYLDARSPALAAQSFEKALTLTRNDWLSLAGLVEAYHALGEQEKAKNAMARLLFLTSDADKGLKWIERAKATGVTAAPRDSSPAAQRNYLNMALDRFGPNTWEPYEAPKLDVRDPEGKSVSLQDYKEKNLVLVFYLGRECLHCMKQLQHINAKRSDWDRLQTVVLAVSSNKPEDNARYVKEMAVPAARILSDKNFENARRFKSYDDFEEMELHSTILIDKKGRVHWARNGGAPFEDIPFLIRQVERMNQFVDAESTKTAK
jgi:peroxiredoxin